MKKDLKIGRKQLKIFKNDKIIILLAPKFSKIYFFNFALKGNNLILNEKPISTDLTQLENSKNIKIEYLFYITEFFIKISILKNNVFNEKKLSSSLIKIKNSDKKFNP